MKVYMLLHVYQYGENYEHEEAKRIGIYSSKACARTTIK